MEIGINYLAVAACVIVALPVGFLWFGPLFGPAWARHMGFDEMQPNAAQLARSMLIYALGSLLIAYVLAHLIEVWRPSSWNTGPDEPAWTYALNGGFWTWLGFFLPVQMGRVAWEQKKWGLVVINSSFDLTRLMIFAFILAYWR